LRPVTNTLPLSSSVAVWSWMIPGGGVSTVASQERCKRLGAQAPG
jgi:hypothetical protein